MNNHPVIFNVVYIIPHDNRSGGLGHGYTRIDRWEDHHVACRPHSGIGFVRDLNSDKKTPEGVYAGFVGLRKNYGYVGWQWKVV